MTLESKTTNKKGEELKYSIQWDSIALSKLEQCDEEPHTFLLSQKTPAKLHSALSEHILFIIYVVRGNLLVSALVDALKLKEECPDIAEYIQDGAIEFAAVLDDKEKAELLSSIVSLIIK